MQIKLSRGVNGKKVLLSSRRPAGVRPQELELRKYVQQSLARLWRACAREFFIELVKHIHVDTGMSYASVIPLARKAHLASELMSNLSPRRSRPSHTSLEGTYIQGSPANVATGIAYGNEAVAQKRHDIDFGTPANIILRFRFEVVVYQYDKHDIQWQSVNKAEAVFKLYWRTNISKYLSPTDYFSWLVQGRLRPRGITDGN